MRRHHLRWYVFGAQAAVAYGRPRMTADVDVAIAMRRLKMADLVASLERERIAPRLIMSERFLRETRLLPMLHLPTGLPLDVLCTTPGIQEEFMARRRSVDVGGVRVPMISPEDLVATKVLAGRRKDFEDVRGVLLERGKRLDLDQIRDVVLRLEMALGDSRLSRRLERLVRQAWL